MIVLFVIGLTGATMFVLGVLHVPFGVSVAVAGLACVAWGTHFSRSGPAGAGARFRVPKLPVVLAAIPLLAIAFTAATVPLNDFDGRAFWLLKAKALATERAIDGPFFHGQEPRNQYPLLMPLDASLLMIATGTPDDRYARWLYVLTFAAFVLLIGRRLGPWYAAILAWLPQFAFVSEGSALSGYSDIAVAAFVAGGFIELIDARSPIRFGFWLSFLVLTKNEGLPIAVILFIAGAFVFRRRVALSAIPLVVAVAALFTWRSGIPKTDEENYIALLPSLPTHLDRLPSAIVESAKHLFYVANWGLFWIAAVIALTLLAWRREWLAPAVVASMAALYIGAYVVTQWAMPELIAVSADRLLMQMIGPALYAISRCGPSVPVGPHKIDVTRRDVH